MKTHRLLFVILTAVAPALQAAVLVEIKAVDGVSRIFREGAQVRMEMGGERGYMIVNTDKQTMHVVMPEQRQVMDMSDMLRNTPAGAGGGAVDVTFDKQGSGPKIAGYKTTRYLYSASGSKCGTLFTSRDAMKDTGLDEMFSIMERMAAQSQAMMAAFNKDLDPCEQASQELSANLDRLGAPMRVLDASGKPLSEVIRIDRKAKLPVNAFVIPAGYQVNNPQQMMQQMQQQMPDMQKMIEQMQQSGQVPPEAMERMKQMR